MKHRNLLLIWLFILVLIAFACRRASVFEQSISFKAGWGRFDTAIFRVSITDTISPHSFHINIRNDNNYRFSNLYIFLHTTFPGGTKTQDTLELILAGKNGRWLGKGAGSIKENDILLKTGLVFPETGNYTFSIEQAMREEELAGVNSIGIRIEKDKD